MTTLKAWIIAVVNYYNTNTKFHSFVGAMEAAIISFGSTWSYGIPSTKSAWIALGSALVKALWDAGKRWSQTNIATSSVVAKKADGQ